jgi:hypothetical protein
MERISDLVPFILIVIFSLSFTIIIQDNIDKTETITLEEESKACLTNFASSFYGNNLKIDSVNYSRLTIPIEGVAYLSDGFTYSFQMSNGFLNLEPYLVVDKFEKICASPVLSK